MSVRLALLGVAHVHALSYAALIREWKGVQLLGFWEEDPEVAHSFAAATGVRGYPLDELLSLRPHGVIVCGVNTRRLPAVQAAAAAGAHVLCEKPLATTEADALAIRAACEAAGVRLVMAFPARFSAAAVDLRAQIAGHQLGTVLAYSGVNHSVAPDREHPWFGDAALAGGGAGTDHVVHLADLLRFFGEEPAEVYARFRPVPEWVRPEHAQIDAAGFVTLRLASGATATIDPSWSRPPGYPRWGQLRLDVTGTEGLMSLDVFAQVLHQSGGGYRWSGYGEDLNALMLADFVRVCREDVPGRSDWDDGQAALKVVLAAYASHASGQPVRLTEA